MRIQRIRETTKILLIAVLLLFSLTAAGAAEKEAGNAAGIVEKIIKDTGIRGGLAVHADCGNSDICAALARSGSFHVHGLVAADTDARETAARIYAAGLAEKITIDRIRGDRLPHVDNLARLVICSADTTIPREEILRVVSPRGAACFIQGEKVEIVRKPVPKEIGEWTHFLHSADNNATVNDRRAGPPRSVQWTNGPDWGRSHEQVASLSAMVTAGGRIFTIEDKGVTGLVHLPSVWRLIARDAWSGVLLWEREIQAWEPMSRPFRQGPTHLPRRLVAVGDRVYVTLGYGKPVSVLDAETGKTITEYTDTADTEEILVCGKMLLAVRKAGDPADASNKRRIHLRTPRALTAIDTQTGKTLWTLNSKDTSDLLPLSATISGDRVFFAAKDTVVALNAKDGAPVWSQSYTIPIRGNAYWSVTMLAADGVLLAGGMDKLTAFNAADGKPLWNCRMSYGFNSAGDVFVVGNTVWLWNVPELTEAQKKEVSKKTRKDYKYCWGYVSDHYGRYEARDLKTGEMKKTFPVKKAWTAGHHHRCYRNKATSRYIITGKRGMEFIDLSMKKRTSKNRWIRGMCQYGIMPANGMVYVPPHPCRCYQAEKISGFFAVVSGRKPRKKGEPLETGPAYESAAAVLKPAAEKSASDWPMYRHDALRSASTASSVSIDPDVLWTAALGSRISAPVIQDGRVYVSEIDANAIHCLDAEKGNKIWSFHTYGIVDSPPALFRGFLYFGSRDGRVTCVRARDGALAWCRRAAREDRLIGSSGKPASAWPVHGAVYVHPGSESRPPLVYTSAGRSRYLDKGISLSAWNAGNGKWAGKGMKWRGPYQNDIPASDGKGLFLRGRQICHFPGAGKHHRYAVLAPEAGFLDSHLFDRTIWSYRQVHGHLLAFTGNTVYGTRSGYHIGKKFLASKTSIGKLLIPGYNKYKKNEFPYGTLVFATQGYNRQKSGPKSPRWTFRSAKGDRIRKYRWMKPVPIQVRAMVSAAHQENTGKRVLLIAGWPDKKPETIIHKAQPQTGLLWIMDAQTGEKLSELELEHAPLFDGIAVAKGKIYIALENGSLVCLGEK